MAWLHDALRYVVNRSTGELELVYSPLHEKLYNDGPDWPKTPAQVAAERAYHEGFVAAAREASRWLKVDESANSAAWGERRRSEILVPSSVYFGDERLRSEQIVYRAGH